MRKRMNYYLTYYNEKTQMTLTDDELTHEKEQLLIQIQFFQHERLVHLIVTVLFAILTVCSIFITLVASDYLPPLLILDLLFFSLLIPYIYHYYILENGVQTLYSYYDKLDKAHQH